MKRAVIIILSLIALILLSWYGPRHRPWTRLNDCLKDPASCQGKRITHYREPRVGTLYADGFELIQRHGPSIRVYCDTSDLVEGEYVGLIATFDKDHLIAHQVRIAKNRKYKIWLSVIPLLGAVVFFFIEFKWHPKQMVFKRRSCRI